MGLDQARNHLKTCDALELAAKLSEKKAHVQKQTRRLGSLLVFGARYPTVKWSVLPNVSFTD